MKKSGLKNRPEKLTKDQLTNANKVTKDSEDSRKPVEVNFIRASANWVPSNLPPTLNEVTFKIEPGQLCALAGNVGSGKSAILNLLLRELSLGAGTVSLTQKTRANGAQQWWGHQQMGFHVDNDNLRISYASQDAWMFSGTVRNNILFGQEYEPKRYEQV